jgi:hypothetical protein
MALWEEGISRGEVSLNGIRLNNPISTVDIEPENLDAGAHLVAVGGWPSFFDRSASVRMRYVTDYLHADETTREI